MACYRVEHSFYKIKLLNSINIAIRKLYCLLGYSVNVVYNISDTLCKQIGVEKKYENNMATDSNPESYIQNIT